MLVLSRHREQVIRIGHDVSVIVMDIRGDRVRLGIEAPKHVPVHRDEVYQAITRKMPAAEPLPWVARLETYAADYCTMLHEADPTAAQVAAVNRFSGFQKGNGFALRMHSFDFTGGEQRAAEWLQKLQREGDLLVEAT